LTQANAIPAITAAAGQWENDPNERPIGLADRAEDSSPTPTHKTAAPATSHNWTARRGTAWAGLAGDACLDWARFVSGTARISAQIRLVVSSGSTTDRVRCPIDQAASTWPPIMARIPASQRGARTRSAISRSDRKRDAGSRAAAFCCSTNPVPIRSAASRVIP
jgi:hypothetical protein